MWCTTATAPKSSLTCAATAASGIFRVIRSNLALAGEGDGSVARSVSTNGVGQGGETEAAQRAEGEGEKGCTNKYKFAHQINLCIAYGLLTIGHKRYPFKALIVVE